MRYRSIMIKPLSMAVVLMSFLVGCDKPGGSDVEQKSAELVGEDGRLTVPKITAEQVESLTLDGRLDDSLWSDIPALQLNPFGGGDVPETTAKVAYSDDAIIVGAYLEDENIWSVLDERDDSLWTEEVIEIFLAPDDVDGPYVELQVNPLGTIFDARFEAPLGQSSNRRADIERARSWDLEGLEVAVYVDGEVNDPDDDDEFWSVEMVIPFAGMDLDGAPPAEGDVWRVNLYRFDRPDDDTSIGYGWSTEPRGDFHQIDKFGYWTFGSGQ